VDKKFKADNGLGNLFWGVLALVLLIIIVYKFSEWSNIWSYVLYFVFTILFIMSTTIKEYIITDQNFLEIRLVLKLFSKNKRIPVGDILGIKKQKKNQLRIDLVRGFEVLKVKQSDIDEMISELTERNPRIKVVREVD
jgi:low affinity Fe/Cu permease